MDSKTKYLKNTETVKRSVVTRVSREKRREIAQGTQGQETIQCDTIMVNRRHDIFVKKKHGNVQNRE